MGHEGEKFLLVHMAAGRLDKSRETVRRYIREGKLEAFREGRPWLIPERAVEALKEGSTENP